MSRIYLCLRCTAREYNFRLLLRLKGNIPGWNSWRFQCIPDLIMLYNIWQCQNRPRLLYGYICLCEDNCKNESIIASFEKAWFIHQKKSQIHFFTKIQICRFIQILLICNTDLSNYFFWIILTRVITFLNVIRQKDEKCILNVGYQALWYSVVIKPVCTSFVIHTRTRPTISSPCFEYEFYVLWPKTWYRNNSYLFIESVFTLSSSCRKNELVQYLY